MPAVDDPVPPPLWASDVELVGAVDVGGDSFDVDVEVCVCDVEEVVGGEVLVVLSVVVVGLGHVVVVVTGGPGLFARTELGENGGCMFGFAAPNVHASTLPGGGS